MGRFDTEKRVNSARTGNPASSLRFEVLDSWRGICALLVAMMHFPASGPLGESPVIRNAFLFVDYFFVLSGFVIAHGYGQKLADGVDYLRFAVVRFGRIYPLHLAVLLLFVAFEALRWASPALRGDGAPPFSDGNSLAELISNLLLLNGIGMESRLTWNSPSWSISAEFWTYLAFGGAVVLLGRRYWLALVPAIVAGPVILYLFSPKLMDATWDFGFVRCVYGFAVGALLYRFAGPALLRERSEPPAKDTRTPMLLWTLAEAAAIAAVVLFVARVGRETASLAAPFIFALTLFVFAQERGCLSRLLKGWPFLWLGTLSYGIYMVHIFVQARMINAATLIERLTNVELVAPFSMHGETFFGFGGGALFGTAMLGVMIVLVVTAAFIARVLVETPFQRLSRRVATGLFGQPGSRQGQLADAGASV